MTSATHGQPPIAHPPDGRRIVWAADWTPIEGAPPGIPGVVTCDLPDDWAVVSWVDKDGWYSPDAVYEARFLRGISQEDFDELVAGIRGSDWTGVVHDTPSRTEPVATGATVSLALLIHEDSLWDSDMVAWRDATVGGVRGLVRQHPGTIIEIGTDDTVRVRWIDKEGELDSPHFIPSDAVTPIDQQEATELAVDLRSSDWAGLAVS